MPPGFIEDDGRSPALIGNSGRYAYFQTIPKFEFCIPTIGKAVPASAEWFHDRLLERPGKPAKKFKKVSAGQKEMLMPFLARNRPRRPRQRSQRQDHTGSRLSEDSDSAWTNIYQQSRYLLEFATMPSRPRDLADCMARQERNAPDGFLRETFSLPRDEARVTARAFLKKYPNAAYMSEVESWRELPDDCIEFTMRRLRTAD